MKLDDERIKAVLVCGRTERMGFWQWKHTSSVFGSALDLNWDSNAGSHLPFLVVDTEHTNAMLLLSQSDDFASHLSVVNKHLAHCILSVISPRLFESKGYVGVGE